MSKFVKKIFNVIKKKVNDILDFKPSQYRIVLEKKGE